MKNKPKNNKQITYLETIHKHLWGIDTEKLIQVQLKFEDPEHGFVFPNTDDIGIINTYNIPSELADIDNAHWLMSIFKDDVENIRDFFYQSINAWYELDHPDYEFGFESLGFSSSSNFTNTHYESCSFYLQTIFFLCANSLKAYSPQAHVGYYNFPYFNNKSFILTGIFNKDSLHPEKPVRKVSKLKSKIKVILKNSEKLNEQSVLLVPGENKKNIAEILKQIAEDTALNIHGDSIEKNSSGFTLKIEYIDFFKDIFPIFNMKEHTIKNIKPIPDSKKLSSKIEKFITNYCKNLEYKLDNTPKVTTFRDNIIIEADIKIRDKSEDYRINLTPLIITLTNYVIDATSYESDAIFIHITNNSKQNNEDFVPEIKKILIKIKQEPLDSYTSLDFHEKRKSGAKELLNQLEKSNSFKNIINSSDMKLSEIIKIISIDLSLSDIAILHAWLLEYYSSKWKSIPTKQHELDQLFKTVRELLAESISNYAIAECYIALGFYYANSSITKLHHRFLNKDKQL